MARKRRLNVKKQGNRLGAATRKLSKQNAENRAKLKKWGWLK